MRVPEKASEPPLLVIIVLLKQYSNPCLCLSNILEELSVVDTQEAIEARVAVVGIQGIDDTTWISDDRGS